MIGFIMNVLSCFDGMSCGQIALERAGIKVDNYYASEIDKFAIKVTQANYPDTIQLGDIKNVKAKDLPKIDLLLGGSPCQGFSSMGHHLNFEDPRSKLFFEYVRLLKECKPRYFLLENVKMRKEHQDTISEIIKRQPIEINSSLLSAQRRRRLYWTNIPRVRQPKDLNITIKHVLNYNANGSKERNLCLFMYKAIKNKQCRIVGLEDKSYACLTKQHNWNNSGIINDNGLRVFSPLECERLQTVPDNYTNHVSNTQRYKMIGNSWTVNVIAHILKYAKRLKNE